MEVSFNRKGEMLLPAEYAVKEKNSADLNLNIENSNAVSAEDVNENESVDFVFEEKPVYEFFKRVFDIMLSLIALIVLSPVFLIIALIVIIDDRSASPVFTQKRCGKDGKIFNVYKFRTMCADAEKRLGDLAEQNEMDGPVFKIKNDPRITRVGKVLRSTSLDELPQFLNILKGDMSFVGPRPALPKEVSQYNDIHRLRLIVKPGVTCYWQIEPERNSISFDRWMELDRKYITERNLWIDIKIIFKTFFVVFRREGC